MNSFCLGKESNEKLINVLAKFSKYIIFKKDKEIFKIGDPADDFFILFSGAIKSYKLVKRRVFINQRDYIKKLHSLKSNNDHNILRKTLSFNRNLEINEYELDRLYEKLLKIEAIKHEVNFKKHVILFITNKYAGKFEDYVKDIENGDIPENISDEEIKSRLYDSFIPSLIDQMDDERLFDKENHKAILFDYDFVRVLKVGDYFGESGENPNRRKHTKYYIPDEDTICFSISNGIYQKFIIYEMQKLKNKEILFLNDNHIFKDILRGTFLNNYLKYFTREEFFLGNVIFKEEQIVDKIYFLKDGKMEISLNTSVISLHKYIIDLLNANEEITEMFKNSSLIPEIINQPRYFMENLKKKKHFSISLLSENDIIGLEECYFDFKRLYTATIKTEKAILYSIPIKKFRKIVDLEPKANAEFQLNTKLKISNLIKRMLNIKNNSLHILDEKYSKEIAGDLNCKSGNSISISKNINKDPNYKNYNILHNATSGNYYSVEENNSVEIKNSIRKYFNEFNDLSKQLKKKFDLFLNPNNQEYTFYNDFNYEKTTIKNIKNQLKNFKNSSVGKFLPVIKMRSSFNNYESIESSNLHTKNLSKVNLQNMEDNPISGEQLEELINNNNQNSILENNQNKTIEQKNIEIVKNKTKLENFNNLNAEKKINKNSTFFMTNTYKSKLDSSYDFKNKNNKVLVNNQEKNDIVYSNNNNFSPSNNKINNLNINKYSRISNNKKSEKENKMIAYNNYNNEQIIKKNSPRDNYPNKSYSRNVVRKKNSDSDINCTFKSNIIGNRNCFIPFSVDNSISNIKNNDKKLQMTLAKKLYKNQTYINFIFENK